MSRRRYSGKKQNQVGTSRKKQGKKFRSPGNYFSPRKPGGRLSEEEIISFISMNDGQASFKEILTGIDLARGFRKELRTLLKEMCNRGLLSLVDAISDSRHSEYPAETPKKQDKTLFYKLGTAQDILEGVISAHPRGFGFATVTNPPKRLKIEQDLFIPASGMSTARHKDHVLLQITGKRRGRIEARVIRVISRAVSTLVGAYVAGRVTGMVVPEDDRFTFNIIIPREQSCGARNGQAVVAEITDKTPESTGVSLNPKGRIIEVLGDPDSLSVQNEIVIRKFKLPHKFGPQVLKQVEQMDGRIEEEPYRADFRDIPHVTIDGETARDFDDAVSVEKTRTGFRLFVSIADVSHYVKAGSPLDLEAYERGTSVYFPTRVLPMLPERLSNDLCSLVPDQDRLAFSVIMDFDKNGKRKKKKCTKSIIRSRHRLTYTIVKKIIEDDDSKTKKNYKDILKQLGLMAELAAKLGQQRMDRGSIGFELPEAYVSIGPDDELLGIIKTERNRAHKIIEEFMLAANEAVAATFTEKNRDMLYRIHDRPDPVKVTGFSDFASTLGIDLPSGIGTPRWFGKIIAQAAGTSREFIVNNLLLRAMKQACYSPDNVGHFGLAAEDYTHFTSPIRRYPDLMVHRALFSLINSPDPKKPERKGEPSLTEAGLFLSKRERIAVDAEREMVDRIKVRYMADKVGECYDGIIAGVTSFGLFIDLVDLFVNGAVAVANLKEDYFQLDEKNHRLIGRRTGKTYRIGDIVSIRVESVEIQRRRINFVIKENGLIAN